MSNKIKALFFDIDGTLVSFKTHSIPASTIAALEQAKANGVRIFISTGRPVALITVLDDIEHLIDGYITTNGAHCFVGEETVSMHSIPRASVDEVIGRARQERFCCVVVGTKKIAVFQRNELFERIFVEMIKVKGLDHPASLEEVLEEPILQLSPFIDAEAEKRLLASVPDCQAGRWHPGFTDITSMDADKGQGLLSMARHLNIPMEQTMAFGDGGNDLQIVKQAGVGVAMGNAIDSLKDVADFVTTSVDDDGIRRALQHYGVI